MTLCAVDAKSISVFPWARYQAGTSMDGFLFLEGHWFTFFGWCYYIINGLGVSPLSRDGDPGTWYERISNYRCLITINMSLTFPSLNCCS
jgi:hypothetical protein